MDKILKIEEVKYSVEDGVKYAKYIFNDDKIVRVNAETDAIITKDASPLHLELISLYVAGTAKTEKKVKEKKEDNSAGNDLEERKKIIQSGKGAGLGVLLGFLLKLTIIGPVIAGFCSFSFLNDISDKEYLLTEDPKNINFRKGFYASAVFGWLVAIICCAQWKQDMISVLDNEPTIPSQNKHNCFKVWFWIDFIFEIFYIIFSIANFTNRNSYYNKNSNTYYYRSY